MAHPDTRRRPGGRTARVREAVLRATAELMDERGEDAVTVPQVALRSGVHQATIYRRWGTANGLLLDLATARLDQESPVPDTGSLRSDLLAYAKGAAASISAPDGLALVRAVVSSGAADTPAVDAAAQQILERRAADIQQMLERAAQRGEPALHFTDVIDGILAPLYLRIILKIGGINDELLEVLVGRVLAAHGHRDPSRNFWSAEF